MSFKDEKLTDGNPSPLVSKLKKGSQGYGVDLSMIKATLHIEKGCSVPYHHDS